jgi:hypothetical protein
MSTYCVGLNETREFKVTTGNIDGSHSNNPMNVTNLTERGISGGPCVDTRGTELVGMIRNEDTSGHTVVINGLLIQVVIESAQLEHDANIPALQDRTF